MIKIFFIVFYSFITLYSFEIFPKNIVSGSVFVAKVDVIKDLKEPILEFDDLNFTAIDYSMDKYYFLVPVNFRTTLGKKDLNIYFKDLNNNLIKQKHNIEIVNYEYKSETIKVKNEKIKPDKIALKKIMEDQKIIKKAYLKSVDKKLLDNKFELPLKEITVTSEFGNKRMFNNELKSYHTGVDFRARTPKEVFAPADAIVKMARDNFYGGNEIILEHGNGIFSAYSHLSKFYVSTGDFVKKGDKIALTGKTGRVNAPHLHWKIIINTITVNPIIFVDLYNSLQQFK